VIAGVLATALPVGPQLVVHLGLEGDTQSLDVNGRLALVVEEHFQDSNTRVIVLGNNSGEEVELAVWSASGRGIEDATHFVGVARLGFNDQVEPLHLERHYAVLGDLICVLSSPKQAMTV
jgi:hypothetical protein